MDHQADSAVAIRDHSPAIIGWLTFLVVFCLVQRASQNLLVGFLLANVFHQIGVLSGGYEGNAGAIAFVAWFELAIMLAIGFALAHPVCRCIRDRQLAHRIKWALLASATMVVLTGITGGEFQSVGRDRVAVLSLAILAGLAAYVSFATKRHATSAGGQWSLGLGRDKLNFSLRALLACTTVVCAIVGWVTYHFNWIGERHRIEAREELMPSPFSQPPALPPLSLRLLGETEYKSVLFTPGPCGPVELARLKSLFPESVVIELETPWAEYWAECDRLNAPQFESSGRE